MAHILIHLYGASGSGTSTLGRALAERFSMAFFDVDDYFWLPTDPPFTQKRPRDARIAKLQNDLAQVDKAVLSGSVVDWGDCLIPSFTLAVRLVTPTDVRIHRIRAREYARFGDRIHTGGDMHAEHMAFVKWASAYDSGDVTMRSRAAHDAWEKRLPCQTLTIDGCASVEENCEKIAARLML